MTTNTSFTNPFDVTANVLMMNYPAAQAMPRGAEDDDDLDADDTADLDDDFEEELLVDDDFEGDDIDIDDDLDLDDDFDDEVDEFSNEDDDDEF